MDGSAPVTAQTDSYTTEDGRKIGGVVMEMKNISLRFGGVTAIKDISFDIREGEVRAIIGSSTASIIRKKARFGIWAKSADP